MSDDSDDTNLKHIDDALSALGLSGSATLTDEQWRERDAEIQDARDAESAGKNAKQRERHRTALAEAGFPRRAIDWAVAADENVPAIRRVRDWDPRTESTLVLSGPKGCGKTVAAAWWAMQQRPVPTFVRATTFAASSRYERDERERWLKASALVLDDLGTEYLDAKGSFLVDLDELLDVFYGDYKPLLITTNCTMKVFQDRVGLRITDRLRECGLFYSLTGQSLRELHPSEGER